MEGYRLSLAVVSDEVNLIQCSLLLSQQLFVVIVVAATGATATAVVVVAHS